MKRTLFFWVRLFSVTDYHGIGPKIRAPATVGRRFIRRRVGNRGARAAGDKPPPYNASTQRGFSVREESRTLFFLTMGILLLAGGCQEDPADAPPYVDETVQVPGKGSAEEGKVSLPGPDPYKTGEARLSFGLFYEGQASERIEIDNASVSFYVYDSTFILENDGDRVEGLQSDRVTLAGKPWWGGGIHFATGQSRDLSAWKAMHISFKSKVAFPDLEIKVKAAGKEAGVKVAPLGFTSDNAWHEVAIDLQKYVALGLDLTKVEVPLILVGGAGAQGDQLWIDDFYWTKD